MTKGVWGEVKITVSGGRVRAGAMPNVVTFTPRQALALARELIEGAEEAQADIDRIEAYKAQQAAGNE